MSAKKAGIGSYQMATVAIYVFLIVVLTTYFLPIISVNIPALGKKSWSVSDVVKSLPKGTGKKEEKKGQLNAKFDFMDVVKEISTKSPETKSAVKVSPQFIMGILVPIALALTYFLTVLNLFLGLLKKNNMFMMAATCGAICSAYTLVGTYFLGQAAQRAFADSMAKVADSAFSVITQNFVQKVSIQPETGLYVLVAFSVLVLLAGRYRSTTH